MTTLASCISLRIGGSGDGNFFRADGVANAYATTRGLDGWDGSLLRIGILTSTRGSELVSADLGPLVGFGVGIVGARVRVLPLEVAAGALFYAPKPPAKKPPEPPQDDAPSDDPDEPK